MKLNFFSHIPELSVDIPKGQSLPTAMSVVRHGAAMPQTYGSKVVEGV